MPRKAYLFGGLRLTVDADAQVADADFFPLFRTDGSVPPDFTVRVLQAPLPTPTGREILRTNHRRRVLADGTTYDFTNFSDTLLRTCVPYACSVRKDKNITLYVDYGDPPWDTMLFDAINVPDLFLETGAAVVHAALIGAGNAGVLFAGPPGQGKSTQARLWQIHRQATVINGDRAAVRMEDGGVSAYGIPFCGSSRVCLNEKRPVKAIVFPEKAAENTVLPLSAFEAFKLLLGCLSYTQADPAAQDLAVGMAEKLAAGVPCFLLRCRPDAGAVETLSEMLFH